MLEGKKVEYRELLSTLSESYHTIISRLPDAASGPIGAEENRVTAEAWTK
jgi:hypothetical protein